ncbi:TlpA family protein disulfide reductase [Sphingobacterium sp. BIGb0165]|uniref:TlpA family protein disulfide reductase n=1 Tax=Sphingobacterium sp. BIGb0165 TaxID=2940615 RepID=UPI0021682BD0|nr:TlpA family protein disulfide reductase [Sphingobacterium sp. BIGb0165]MCS4227956.1 thiol-disulfide isomerase/thioredoxin [Sphingobacterium sp. BIGb0165]
MRHFFRVGEVLPHLKTTCLNSALLSILCLVSMFSLSAQMPRKDSGADGPSHTDPVMLGFRVPEEFWSIQFTVFENGTYKKQTLERYRGKPLILDFWATWCTSCMPNFPKLDRFKERYGDDINFLLVNSYDLDTAKVVDIFVGEKYAKYRTKTPSILFDSYLKQLFPHQSVPIFIWLDDFGRLGATSISDFLNENQIEVLTNKRKGRKK